MFRGEHIFGDTGGTYISSIRYPAQEHVGGDNKIPSILYYDRQGAVKAVGAETLQQQIVEQAEEENWIKLEW